MKKYINDLIIVFILLLIIFISYFYIPQSAKSLNNKIIQSSPLVLDDNRFNLIKEYDDYLADNLPENNPKLYFYWYSKQRKLSDLRVKAAIEQIKNTNVEKDKIAIWSLLNMGVVIKTSSKTMAVDTANLPFSTAHNELLNIVDVFLVTHKDMDHYDQELLKKALNKNKKVILLDNFIFESDKPDNIFKLTSGKERSIDGINVTAYQTDHRGDNNFYEPVNWFMLEVDGFKLLHTGDGRNFKNKEESEKVYSMKDFDILLANNQLHPYNIRDLSPKVLIPLHLFKFMSGNDLYQESTIKTVSAMYEQYQKDLQGIRQVFLLPGESFTTK